MKFNKGKKVEKNASGADAWPRHFVHIFPNWEEWPAEMQLDNLELYTMEHPELYKAPNELLKEMNGFIDALAWVYSPHRAQRGHEKAEVKIAHIRKRLQHPTNRECVSCGHRAGDHSGLDYTGMCLHQEDDHGRVRPKNCSCPRYLEMELYPPAYEQKPVTVIVEAMCKACGRTAIVHSDIEHTDACPLNPKPKPSFAPPATSAGASPRKVGDILGKAPVLQPNRDAWLVDELEKEWSAHGDNFWLYQSVREQQDLMSLVAGLILNLQKAGVDPKRQRSATEMGARIKMLHHGRRP